MLHTTRQFETKTSMKIPDFEQELKQLDSDLEIRINEKLPVLAGVYYKGEFLCACPPSYINEDRLESYGAELPNGTFAIHRSRPEIIAIVEGMLSRFKTDKDYADAFLGRGKYSAEQLK